ncbi:MAG: hypothetical protein JW779_12080, partial [Candidatus Thorarchaeota archaeon]|nr:hypothetical protein [Candidatus Thorarchaeota archaeon]
ELGSQGVEYTSQDFSRRLKMLNGNFVSGYHVYVDAQAFDLYSNVIITAKCDQVFSEMLRKRIASTPVPFRSTLKLSKNFLFWYLRLPSTHLSEVLDFLHPQVTDLELTMVDYRKTEVYILWPEAFDEEAKSWKADEDFLLCRYGK